MADHFRPLLDSLKQATENLVAAIDSALAANEEHEDLRETVQRLENLVIAQGQDIRALRDRLEGS